MYKNDIIFCYCTGAPVFLLYLYHRSSYSSKVFKIKMSVKTHFKKIKEKLDRFADKHTALFILIIFKFLKFLTCQF